MEYIVIKASFKTDWTTFTIFDQVFLTNADFYYKDNSEPQYLTLPVSFLQAVANIHDPS